MPLRYVGWQTQASEVTRQLIRFGGAAYCLVVERKYREEEVRKILEIATSDRSTASAAPGSGSLTLAEIQGIADEVGIDAQAVARAAAAIDKPSTVQSRNSLGAPVEVGITIPLSRPLSDDEWQRLVAELQATFRARGKVTQQGGVREWRRGNLHAVVGPASTGYRLTLGTIKGNAAGVTAIGVSGILASAATWTAHFVISDPTSLVAPILFGAVGVGALVANWLRLPPWARQREAQMNHIASLIPSIITPEPPGDEK